MSAVKFIVQREFPETSNRMVPLERQEPVIKVSQHEDVLAEAVAAARAQAFIEGKAEADGEETARLARAMESVAMALEQLRHDLDGIQAMASDEAIRFAQQIALKVAGKVMDAQPLAMIEDTGRAIFDDLRGQPHVAVRVAPDLVDAAKERLSGIARERGFEGRLIVMGEPEIMPGDVRIEWADGGIIRDRHLVERTIAAGVERALATRQEPIKEPIKEQEYGKDSVE
jgi:flagellar assembly protein FliH